MTAPAIRLAPRPTADEAVDLLVYAFDRIKPKNVHDILNAHEENEYTSNVQTVSNLGVDHGLFHDDAALLFYEAKDRMLSPGITADCRLLFLESSSWLLWRRQTGGFSKTGIPSIKPDTWHYHTTELYPAFRELGIEGERATAAMQQLFTIIAPHVAWPSTWRGLRGRLVRTYRELV